MKRALLLFAMFVFIGTAYNTTASVNTMEGLCNDTFIGGGHKHDENCEKNCKKGKESKKCSKKSSAKKRGCCSKGGSSSAKMSCHDKSGSKSTEATEENKEENK